MDLFRLNGFVRLTLEGHDEPVDLLPPVVEESIERDGSFHLIINDGMHRVYMALREWVTPEVILVRGIPKTLPYYAFAVPGGWDKVEELDELPAGYLKKWHRIANYHALYRNFNSAFSNVGGPSSDELRAEHSFHEVGTASPNDCVCTRGISENRAADTTVAKKHWPCVSSSVVLPYGRNAVRYDHAIRFRLSA